jgi:DNA-binding response OmpR family regulator
MSAGQKLLIVDDDEQGARALGQRLERRGFVVKVVTEGINAVEIIESEKIELVLLDIVMPKTDGLQVLKNIRAKWSSAELPIIMVTAVNDSIEIFEAFKNGANDYVTKPPNIDAAVSRLRGQFSLIELNREKIRKSELEAVSAMVVTYHHEINNPLATARSEIQLLNDEGAVNGESAKRILNALDQIASVLAHAQEVAQSKQLNYSIYESETKMLNLKKAK